MIAWYENSMFAMMNVFCTVGYERICSARVCFANAAIAPIEQVNRVQWFFHTACHRSAKDWHFFGLMVSLDVRALRCVRGGV